MFCAARFTSTTCHQPVADITELMQVGHAQQRLARDLVD
jgi:hypothetical protein